MASLTRDPARDPEGLVRERLDAALPAGVRAYANVCWLAPVGPGRPARDGEIDLLLARPRWSGDPPRMSHALAAPVHRNTAAIIAEVLIFHDSTHALCRADETVTLGLADVPLPPNCRKARPIHDFACRWYTSDVPAEPLCDDGREPEIVMAEPGEPTLDALRGVLGRPAKIEEIAPERITVPTGVSVEHSAVCRQRRFRGGLVLRNGDVDEADRRMARPFDALPPSRRARSRSTRSTASRDSSARLSSSLSCAGPIRRWACSSTSGRASETPPRGRGPGRDRGVAGLGRDEREVHWNQA